MTDKFDTPAQVLRAFANEADEVAGQIEADTDDQLRRIATKRAEAEILRKRAVDARKAAEVLENRHE